MWPFQVISFSIFRLCYEMILVLLVSKAVWCDLLDDFKLWRPFGVKTPKAFFWVRVWSLTGRGNATHCQVQKLMPPGNWFVVVCPSCLFYTLSLCLLLSLILLFWSVSLPAWESSIWKQKCLEVSLHLAFLLACCDIFTAFSESRLWFSPSS